MKLSQYAKEYSVTYTTAYNRHKRGLLNTFQDSLGNILIRLDEEETKKDDTKRAIIYARVSSNSMKDNLKRQSKRLEEWAISNGFEIVKIIEEIGSGMNDNRKKLNSILNLNNSDFNYLIVEHKDRLTRFGFNYIETLLNIKNQNIIIVNKTDDKNIDIMEDLISIIYSFSARIYGNRKAKKIVTETTNTLEKIK